MAEGGTGSHWILNLVPQESLKSIEMLWNLRNFIRICGIHRTLTKLMKILPLTRVIEEYQADHVTNQLIISFSTNTGWPIRKPDSKFIMGHVQILPRDKPDVLQGFQLTLCFGFLTKRVLNTTPKTILSFQFNKTSVAFFTSDQTNKKQLHFASYACDVPRA